MYRTLITKLITIENAWLLDGIFKSESLK